MTLTLFIYAVIPLTEMNFPPKCEFFVAYKWLFTHCQMNAGSNKANLVHILRSPLVFSEGIHENWPPSLRGFIIKRDPCLCWGGLAVMCSVIQIVIWLFRCWILPLLSLSLHLLSACVSFPASYLCPPGCRCTYCEQHLVIFNYDLSSDQLLMDLEEGKKEDPGEGAPLLSTFSLSLL